MIRKLLAGWLYGQARWWLGLGRYGWGHGSRLMRAACRLWPRHPEACHWVTYINGKELLHRGQSDAALPLLLEAERTLPPEVAVRGEIGLAQAMAGHYDQAIVILERAVKEEHAAAREDVWSSLAWSYLKTGRAAKAREACLRAEQVEVQSSRLALLYRLATGVGLGALPVSEVTDLLGRVPDASLMVLEFARQQAREGRRRLATAAVSAFPETEQPHAFSIIAYGSLNEDDPDTAAWAAEQIADATGDERLRGDVAILRAEVALRLNDLAQALAQAREALAVDSTNGRAHEMAGAALLLGGEWDAAVDEMIESLHTGHAGALAAGVAALAALEVGDKASARGLFLAARAGDGLGCATSHIAQARLLMSEGSVREALQLAEWGVEELTALPSWAAQPAVLQRLPRTLRETLQLIRDAGDPDQQAAAVMQLQRLDDYLRQHP